MHYHGVCSCVHLRWNYPMTDAAWVSRFWSGRARNHDGTGLDEVRCSSVSLGYLRVCPEGCCPDCLLLIGLAVEVNLAWRLMKQTRNALGRDWVQPREWMEKVAA